MILHRVDCLYCGWLYFFKGTNFRGLNKYDTFVGFKIRGRSIFFHNSYRKLPFRWYWNSWIETSTKTTKICTPWNLSHPQYSSTSVYKSRFRSEATRPKTSVSFKPVQSENQDSDEDTIEGESYTQSFDRYGIKGKSYTQSFDRYGIDYRRRKYNRRLLLRRIHHFKSD